MTRYKTQGVCASHIDFDVDSDGKIQNVKFHGGCPGNGLAVAKLVQGMPVKEAIARLNGIQCRMGTSCADQLAKALASHAS